MTTEVQTGTTETTQETQPAVDTAAVPTADNTDTPPQTDIANPPAEENQPNPDIPESADGYKVEIEDFDFDDFKAANGAVLESFHAEGMTNKQVEAVVRAYEQHTAVHIDALREEWGADLSKNATFANQAIKAAGLKLEDADSPAFGLRLAAYYGQKLQEDMPPPENAQQSSAESIQELMSSEAYQDENHPEHKTTYDRVQKFYASTYRD